MSSASHPAEREIAEELRLRSATPPVARLSRNVLLVVTAGAGVAVAAAVAYAMTTSPKTATAKELYAVGGPPPERLNSLPADYAQVPKLGPPLPGDLGKPILEAHAPPPAMAATPAVSASEQLVVQEREAARTSRLFASGAEIRGEPAVTAAPGDASSAAGGRTILDGPVDRRTVSSDRLSAPASPYLLQAGSVIPAALVSGIRSDLPGQILGQVTEDVYDSISGRFLLIPQGSKLIGVYDSQIANGQRRVLLAWTRLILPNGKSLVLEKLPAGDGAGYAGLEDQVDRHWRALFGAATLSTVLGVGAELGAGYGDSAILRALRLGTSDTFNQVGQQAVGRALSIPPTLTIRPGMPVRVMVAKDLVLEPYSG
jgi:type IV secretion system protein VirB10